MLLSGAADYKNISIYISTLIYDLRRWLTHPETSLEKVWSELKFHPRDNRSRRSTSSRRLAAADDPPAGVPSVKLGTTWQRGMQRAYKLSFSPGIVDSKLSRGYVHLAKYASWPMEAVGHICKWFHLQTSKESNQTQRIYSLPAKPVKILTWISKWVWNLFQAQQGLRLVYSYSLYPCSSQTDTLIHRLVGRCFK